MAYNRRLRRSQLIQPWGVGSIVPFPRDESLIIAGIDLWDSGSANIINDERLAARLRVNNFKTPPEFISASQVSENNSADKNNFVYAYRFPQWFYCPFCNKMEWVELTKDGAVYCKHVGTNKEGMTQRQMLPERFVVACPQGHIMDFPVLEFVHEDSQLKPSEYVNHIILRKSGNNSATLSGIYYECIQCNIKKNLSGITSSGALESITFLNSEKGMCPGYMPWLGNKHEKCNCGTKDLLVVQKGGTNVWYAETRSSIYIPPIIDTEIERPYLDTVQKILDFTKSSTNDGGFIETLLHNAADSTKLDFEILKKYYLEAVNEKTVNPYENMDEDSYRKVEYDILKRDSGNDSSLLYCKNLSINNYDTMIRRFFKSVSLVYKMTETRAFIGFSRLQTSNKTIDEFKKHISKEPVDWLPAIQNTGEGIFIEFDRDQIEKWKQKNNIIRRAKIITSHYNASFIGKNKNVALINPEYVMIHTFAHLLINELSKRCGYGSSSIRERIYVSKSDDVDMCGLLIYTASGDSEGSLGGLVREGKPKRLEDSISLCLKEAEWCSADPVCIESNGQGPDSCNLAACHNCALLPETCCENGNRLLDRGMLIGTENCDGFFEELIKQD